MPAYSFNGTDLYLRIHLAQKEGLISVISEVQIIAFTASVTPLHLTNSKIRDASCCCWMWY